MMDLRATVAALSSGPWHRLDRPTGARLVEFWGELPALTRATPFGSFAVEEARHAEAPTVPGGHRVHDQPHDRPTPSDKRRSRGENGPGPTPKTAGITPSASGPGRRKTPLHGEADTCRTAAAGDIHERSNGSVGKTDSDIDPDRNHRSTRIDPGRLDDPAAVDTTDTVRVVYDLANRRIGQRANAPCPSDLHQTGERKSAESAVAAAPRSDSGDDIDRRDGDSVLSLIAQSLDQRSGAASADLTQASMPRGADLRIAELPRPDRPTITESRPASANELGEELMELLNDALVAEGRRHGVDL